MMLQSFFARMVRDQHHGRSRYYYSATAAAAAAATEEFARALPIWVAGMAVSTPIIAVLQGAILLQGTQTTSATYIIYRPLVYLLLLIISLCLSGGTCFVFFVFLSHLF